MYSPEISARSEAQIIATSKSLTISKGTTTKFGGRLAEIFNANYSPGSRVLIILLFVVFGIVVMTIVLACTLIIVKGIDARRLFRKNSNKKESVESAENVDESSGDHSTGIKDI